MSTKVTRKLLRAFIACFHRRPRVLLTHPVIFNPQPIHFVSTLECQRIDMSPASCNMCGSTRSTTGAVLLSCSRCKTTFYCGRDCQKEDWQNHRLRCKKIVPFPDGAIVVDARDLATRHPDTFEAPSDEELAAIRPGTMVKICLEDVPGTFMPSIRFWNTVIYVHKRGTDPSEWTFVADTDNMNPIPGLPHSSRVEFKGKNIYDAKTMAEMRARMATMQSPTPLDNMRFQTARSNRR